MYRIAYHLYIRYPGLTKGEGARLGFGQEKQEDGYLLVIQTMFIPYQPLPSPIFRLPSGYDSSR